MSSVRIMAGAPVSFVLYADCPAERWRSIGQTEGTRAAGLAQRVRHAFEGFGTVADVKAEAAPKSAGDTVLSARVVGFVARAEIDSEALDAVVLRELNTGLDPVAWYPHVSGARNWGLVLGGVALAPVAVVAGIAALVSDSARESLEQRYRSLGSVIDTGSIERGENRANPPPSSPFGRVASVAAGGPVSSTDPARDNRTPAQAAAEGLSFQPPAWLVVGGVVVGGLLAVVGIGYAARGIAQAVREVK